MPSPLQREKISHYEVTGRQTCQLRAEFGVTKTRVMFCSEAIDTGLRNVRYVPLREPSCQRKNILTSPCPGTWLVVGTRQNLMIATVTLPSACTTLNIEMTT